MRLSKAHCLEMNLRHRRKSGGYITRQSRVRGPSMAPRMVRASEGTIYGAMFGPGGPCIAEGDDPRHRRWSGRTNRRGDHIWHDIRMCRILIL